MDRYVGLDAHRPQPAASDDYSIDLSRAASQTRPTQTRTQGIPGAAFRLSG